MLCYMSYISILYDSAFASLITADLIKIDTKKPQKKKEERKWKSDGLFL